MSVSAQASPVAPQAVSRPVGLASISTAIAGVGYAVSFVVLKDPLLSAVFLLLGGVLATPVLVAVREQLSEADPVAAGCAILLAIAGALGSAVHGGYDLANAVHPPAAVNPDLPNPVDPRGHRLPAQPAVVRLAGGLVAAPGVRPAAALRPETRAEGGACQASAMHWPSCDEEEAVQ